MSPTLAVDPNRLHRFEQDARAAAALNHPGVLAIEAWCRPVAPRCSFPHHVPVISAVVEQYRPSRHGQRFLFGLPLTSVPHELLRMLLNWPEKLAQAATER